MITEEAARDLVFTYHTLADNLKNKNTKENERALKKHEDLCIVKFDYLIKMKASKYKKFNNYDDLYQEGRLALFRAMSNYDPSKGSFFWWAHHYIGTKIKRSANLHTTIRYPLKEANKHTPHKLWEIPILIEETYCPDKMAESSEAYELITDSLAILNDKQKAVISLAYGIDVDNPYPVNKICKTLNITRIQYNALLKNAMSKVKSNIMNKKDNV